jgi:hypothetical protein
LADGTSREEERPALAFSDLCGIRRRMGVSQSQMAGLMGISTRAVQSYEQGWRNAPPAVQKHAMLLLYLHRRLETRPARPCWEVCGCSAEEREKCPAWLLGEGQLCWLVTGNRVRGRKGSSSWQAKAAQCASCPAMRERLGP